MAAGSAGGAIRDDRRLQAAQLDRPCPRGRRRRVGDRRDDPGAARTPRRTPLHVRTGGGDDRAGGGRARLDPQGRPAHDWALPKWSGIVVVGAIFLILVPAASRACASRAQGPSPRARPDKVINMLQTAINRFRRPRAHRLLRRTGHERRVREHPRLGHQAQRRLDRLSAQARDQARLSDRAVHPAPKRLAGRADPHGSRPRARLRQRQFASGSTRRPTRTGRCTRTTAEARLGEAPPMSVPESKLAPPRPSASGGRPPRAPGLGPSSSRHYPAAHRDRPARDLDAAGAVGAHASGVRSLRLAGVGSPDGGLGAGHERGAIVEAAALSVHRPVRAVRARRDVAVADHRRGGLAERRDLRRPDRLPADRRRRRAAPCPDRRGRVRRARRCSASPSTGTTSSAPSPTR